MASAFFEMNIAMSGLFAAQRGLSVTSNNIGNAATKGYSRQVLDQRASKAMGGMGIGMVGTGVETVQIRRVRDSYLDSKLWSQNDTLGEYTVKTEQNALVESVFGEPSDAGFTAIFNDVFAALDDLTKLPSEGERKEALRQTLIGFSKYYNSASQTLSEFQRDLNFEISAKVDEINMLSKRIESLNKQIYQQEMHGDISNSLRDERELCVDRLSQLVNIEAKEVEVVRADGKKEMQFQVKANGQMLVDHFESRTLTVQARTTGDKLNKQDVEGLFDIKWEDGLDFDMNDINLSGELKGLIDMRDGCGVKSGDDKTENDVTYKGIPYYVKKMDTFVQEFAKTMNEVYNQGADGKQIYTSMVTQDKDGNDITVNVPKHVMFSYTENGKKVPAKPEDFLLRNVDGHLIDENGRLLEDGDTAVIDYSKITAKDFSVSETIYEGSENIRTNFEHDPTTGDNPNESNNDLLLALLKQKDNKHMFKEGDPKDFMISMFSELGISTKEAKMYQKSQTNLTKTIQNQRLSVSQVDTNEEFMNLVKYNQAYQVAAKLLTTMDGIYETTIFKLGNW